ncbi:MAG: DNA polymerase III subunit delta' [Lachnospiraceae bacterium]|nr:DNA polymerase III subunit delta' [Lachnospiraceae bacterium]
MAGFSEVTGHEQIKESLRNALISKKVSNAYIFCGEDGCGKNTLASAFAKALVCEAGYGDSCGMCRSCMRFESGNHPDVRRIIHEKPASIGVDEVRAQLVNDVAEKPYYGGRKVYIIDEAEKLTAEAQNAMLKTLEEPPAYAVILLLANSTEPLLPTILSRCVTLNLRAIGQDTVVRYLMQNCGTPEDQARICAAYSQGNIGKAKAMATQPDFRDMQDYVINMLKRIDGMEEYELIEVISELVQYKDRMSDIFDLMALWYRDVLVLKASSDVNRIIFRNEYYSLQKKANISSYEGLNEIIKAIDKARIRLAANVNFDITMEMLLLTVKEN